MRRRGRRADRDRHQPAERVLGVSLRIALDFVRRRHRGHLAASAYETLRGELDATALALKTKQLEEERARKLAIEAQLASLESRVHPHFLFNTLNSISALVHDDPAAAERVVGQLASLLRASLDSGSMPLVRLDEELAVVRNYLEIERVRFGDRLRYTIEAPAGASAALVPRLSLQTLVENSVKYAVSPRRGGASISIRADRADGRVRIQVEDDGPGFDAADVPDGHGLALVKARLAMTLGDRAALGITSAPGRTCISVSVPLDDPSAETRVSSDSSAPGRNERPPHPSGSWLLS